MIFVVEKKYFSVQLHMNNVFFKTFLKNEFLQKWNKDNNLSIENIQ